MAKGGITGPTMFNIKEYVTNNNILHDQNAYDYDS